MLNIVCDIFPLHTCRMCLGEHEAICHAARWRACNMFSSNKSTGFLIITTVSWYKSSLLPNRLPYLLDLCYHRRLYSTCLWHLTAVMHKLCCLACQWDHVARFSCLICEAILARVQMIRSGVDFYTSRHTPQYPSYPLPRRGLWLQSLVRGLSG